MEYDSSQIRVEKRTINGQEVEIQIVPEGMHGRGWRPDLFDDALEDFVEEEQVDQELPEEDEIFEEEETVTLLEKEAEKD